MPKVSVIVPIYNTEKYLHRCIDSILSQTLKDIEVILVDDGSSDNCPLICDEYSMKDSHVRVIHKENGGAASARNIGIDTALGEYIGFVDADDWIEIDMYERMFVTASNTGAELLLCDYNKVTPNSLYTVIQPIREGYYSKRQMISEYYPHLLMFDNLEFPPTISNCVCLIKTSVIKNNNIRYILTHKYCEDALFGSLCAYYAESFFYLKGQCFYNYNFNPSSTTNSYHSDKWDVFKKIIQDTQTRFSSCNDYDFSIQLNTQIIYFACNALSEIKRQDIKLKQKHSLCNEIINDQILVSALKLYSMKMVNYKLKIILLLMKLRMTWIYSTFF